MRMLESIEKLREYIREHYTIGSYAYDEVTSHVHAIEREISERYIERDKAIEAPLDADGVPWDGSEKEAVRIGLGEDVGVCYIKAIGLRHTLDKGKTWCIFFDDDINGNLAYAPASCFRHVKPRTIGDILREFGKEYIYVYCTQQGKGMSDLEVKYAAELRALLGGDAE